MDLDVVVHVGVHKNCKIAFSPQLSTLLLTARVIVLL